MNLDVIRTHAKDPAYRDLVILLDSEIQDRDGTDFEFYNQFNGSENIKEVVLVSENKVFMGCGTLKKFNEHTAEIKRMFTVPEARGKGIATLILNELSKWALELRYDTLVLETGKRYPEAISLYSKNGFERTENYGPYKGIEQSVCFTKSLT